MKIKFTISSHINSYEKTYPLLAQSLLESGVPAEDIYFFIGGFYEYAKIENENGINVYQVNHNSIDLTGLISVVDLELHSDYWFLLHDTCKVGKQFYSKIKEFNYQSDTVALNDIRCASMNIGAYKMEYLYKIKQQLFQFKNQNYSADNMKLFKQLGIKYESIFLDKTYYYNYSLWTNNGIEDVYDTGVLRQVEVYPDIDLIKYKANYNVQDINNVELKL